MATEPETSSLTVVCRVRPAAVGAGGTADEPACLEIVSVPEERVRHAGGVPADVHASATVSVRSAAAQGSRVFEQVYGPGATQEAVWEGVGRPVVLAFRDGAHGSVISYGQTGSGKTWTMMGSSAPSVRHPSVEDRTANAGIAPRAIAELLGEGGAGVPDGATLTASYVEVYLDGFRDLLAAAPGSGSGACGLSGGIAVKETAERGVHLAGASDTGPLDSEARALEALHRGNKMRSTRATESNASSSRSHALFCLHLRRGGDDGTTHTLILADLAGSEKAKKTGAEGKGMSEANAINRSLSALGLVIKALSEGAPHVPFRDSLLTRVLQESFTRRGARTALLIAMSPDADSAEETLSSFRFAKLCQRVKLSKAEVPRDPVTFEPRTLKDALRLIRTLRATVASLQASAEESARRGGAISCPDKGHVPCSPSSSDWWRRVIAEEGGPNGARRGLPPSPGPCSASKVLFPPAPGGDPRGGATRGAWDRIFGAGFAALSAPSVHMHVVCASWWSLAVTLACTLA